MTAVTFIFIVGFSDRARSQTVNTVGVVGTRDAQETIADNPVPADRRMNLLINISFSYFAAPFARPLRDWFPWDPENRFNASALLGPQLQYCEMFQFHSLGSLEPRLSV